MSFTDLLEFVGAIILSFGGASVIIYKLSDWLAKVWADRLLEEDRSKYQKTLEALKSNYQKELEEYKSYIEKSKALFFRYSEHQFNLYNALWRELCDLKFAADELWHLASTVNLRRFAKQLRKTLEMVEKSRLLLEAHHYQRLQELLNNFSSYQINKKDLIRLRNQSDMLGINDDMINDLIHANQTIKEEYTQVINSIAEAFRRQIRIGS